MRGTLSAVLVVVAFGFGQAVHLGAQSLTTGAIIGTVIDSTGNVVPNVEVTVLNPETGDKRSTVTGANGDYTLAQLLPGSYRVSFSAKRFKVAQVGPVIVGLSRTVTTDTTLQVGPQREVVQVTAAPNMLEPSNPNTTTTVTSEVLMALPNPGNDLTYVAQVAPGAIMNTGGAGLGSGNNNVEFNGLPATSFNLTLDGLDGNNLGAVNLSLGLNSISEASINTLFYALDQGRYGAVQVNYLSKAGTNKWHGNAFETWNGRSMNAANWFLNAQPGPACSATNTAKCKPFSITNEFGASFGGPILKNKLFFFADVEGIRIVQPLTQSESFPSKAYENYVLTQIPEGGYDPGTKMSYAPPPHPDLAIAYYQRAFALYGTPPGGVAVPTRDCPIQGDGSIIALAPGVPVPHGTGCVLKRVFGASSNAHDLYTKFRLDHEIGASDRVWYAFRYQTGVQATYTDSVNSLFSAYSPQIEDGASIGYTHIFSPNLVNEFHPGYNWNAATFKPSKLPAALAASPFVFAGATLTPIFNAGNAWPQGTNNTEWQLVDNLTWVHSSHTFAFGENLARTLESDHNLAQATTPYINLGDAVQYSLDVIGGFARQKFSPSRSEPIGFASLDLYAQDTWKVTPRWTVIYGLRASWNSDPVDQHNNFSRLAGSFYDTSHDVNQPLNSVIQTGKRYEFPSTPLIQWQPRAAIAWAPRPNTVFRAGAGIFSELYGSVLVDDVLGNYPNVNRFFAGAPGTGNPIVATYAVPGSGDGIVGSPNNDALENLAQANANLVGGFHSGVPSCAAANAPANCIPAIDFWAFPKGSLKSPYYTEWSAAFQQAFGRDWMVRLQYAGTKATNLNYAVTPNGFQTVCSGCFAPYLYDPTFRGPDPRFGGITQFQQGANSSYNSLQTTVEKRFSSGLFLQTNYAWSHCIDEFSNEGIPFTSDAQGNGILGNRSLMRGNCDYDVRSSLNGRWVYQLPSRARSHRLKPLLNGWEVDGNIFLHTGFALSVFSGGYFANGNGVIDSDGPGGGGYALPAPGIQKYAKWEKLNAQTPGYPEIQWLNPNAFINTIDPNTGSCTPGETISGGNVISTNDNAQNCQFAGGRNTVFAPGFAWVDLAVGKTFNLTEKVKFRLDAKLYNALNHMNPAFPGSYAGVPASGNTLYDAFTISRAASPPTGLLGSDLGGDTSARMIAFSGKIEF